MDNSRKDTYDALLNKFCNRQIYISSTYRNKIVNVNIIVPNKVVEVTFSDGTKEKSVCQEPDVFSLEQAITICLAKHLLGGSSQYNNTVKKAVKNYEKKLSQIKADKVEKERIEKKKAKRAAYKARREQKRKETEIAEKIAIQKEAYIQAMKDMKIVDNVK